MIDLHTHSTYSDGTFTPEKLCRLAETKNIKILALTDHDTIDGIDDFLSCESNLKKVPGVEISLEIKNGTFHMLGLFVNHKYGPLRENLSRLKTYRKQRNEKILNKLSDFFHEKITQEQISHDNKGELGRPHIAKFLVKKGIVSSVEEAFEKYLAKGKPFYESKEKLNTDDAIKLIIESGGIPVIAHPITLGLDNEKFDTFIRQLVDLGLKGIEAICPLHSKEDCKHYIEIAKKYDLLVTGGSDFHGDNKDNVTLGNLGSCTLPAEYLNKIEKIKGR